MLEIISLAIFLITLGGMVFMIWKKAPLLHAVPEQLIEESFVTRPPLIHSVLERMKTLYQEKYHHYLVFSFLERLLTTLRDMVAQAEQGLFWLLRHVQDRQNGNGTSSKRVRYLNRLHAWKKKNGNGQKQEEQDAPMDGLLPPQ